MTRLNPSPPARLRVPRSLMAPWLILAFLPAFWGAEPAVFPGAGEQTPSRSHYFSWINNAWEGGTESQALINLDFFKWLHDEHGMQLDCYAFDAGNVDTRGSYGSTASAEFRERFPRGFAPIATKAGSFGCRLGMWAGPDGFGDTPEQERQRIEMMLGLCRDDRLAVLKLDACASDLRPEKQDAFVRMIKACRLFQPDLIVLNHRINLGKATPYATTFLFEGAETYIDVHMSNAMSPLKTATHNRAGALSRRLVPGLKRLTEDHGVCLSSCLDYWDDDLVLQAFNRCLILAPEIYGNPWLLRDDEFPRLARIFNLHRRYRDILVNGIALPESAYGPFAVSRGDGNTRFVTLRNLTWMPVSHVVKLDSAIGLTAPGEIEVRQLHPSEKLLGRYAPGTEVKVEVLPFRACLVMASTRPIAEPGVSGCDYAVVQDVATRPAELNLLGFPGQDASIKFLGEPGKFASATLDGRPVDGLLAGESIQVTFPGRLESDPWHRKLGDLHRAEVPADAEALYEATCFAADSNALEVRSLNRSGPTRLPQVQKARDAFFHHPLFIAKGIWDRNLFDGRMATTFNQASGFNPRHGGALRVDLGEPTSIDRLVLRGPGLRLPSRKEPGVSAEVSLDLKVWRPVTLRAEDNAIAVELRSGETVRYFRMNAVPGPLAEIEGYDGSRELDRTRWRASNLFESYASAPAVAAWTIAVTLDDVPAGSYLAVPLPGRHEPEGAFAAVRVNGRPMGAPDRAVSYNSNVWEAPVPSVPGNYTYFIRLTPDMAGQALDIVVLVMKDGVNEIRPEAWLTAYPVPFAAKRLVLARKP